jgi:hypothetical protein
LTRCTCRRRIGQVCVRVSQSEALSFVDAGG